jgi:hypothetical protein
MLAEWDRDAVVRLERTGITAFDPPKRPILNDRSTSRSNSSRRMSATRDSESVRR